MTPVRKIENAEVMLGDRVGFRVVVSFNGLNKGDVFEQDADDLAWADRHVEVGYLERIEE